MRLIDSEQFYLLELDDEKIDLLMDFKFSDRIYGCSRYSSGSRNRVYGLNDKNIIRYSQI